MRVDDAAAKRKVHELIGSMGFRPIDVGPLAMALALEGMALINISLNAEQLAVAIWLEASRPIRQLS